MTIFRFDLTKATILAALAPCFVIAQPLSVPSGMETALFDVILDENVDTARFRFVAPAIDADQGGLGFQDVISDIEYLCRDVVLPALIASERAMSGIVISLSEREIAFGEIAPDVTQYFQPFRIEGDTCIWEQF